MTTYQEGLPRPDTADRHLGGQGGGEDDTITYEELGQILTGDQLSTVRVEVAIYQNWKKVGHAEYTTENLLVVELEEQVIREALNGMVAALARSIHGGVRQLIEKHRAKTDGD